LRRILSLLVPLTIVTPAWAQEADTQLWTQANVSKKVAKDVTLTVEGIARWSDNVGGLFHTELGGLVAWDATDSIELAIGYRHTTAHNESGIEPNEERLRQHVVFQLGNGFATRLRFEERFHSEGGEVGFRLRPQLRYTHDLGDKGFKLFATHESFVNFNTTDWGQRGGLERVRHTMGVTVPITEHLDGDFGYLNQYRFGRDGDEDQIEHAISVTMNLDL
jgi:hypothetical protein